jgi:hypothetical protein
MTTIDEARPVLTNGWEADVPSDDTELRRFVLAWSEFCAAPVAAMGGRVVRTPDAVTSDLGRPASYWSSATLLRPPAHDRWDRVLDGVERTLFREGSGAVHLWSAWPTPDLSARGWELQGHPPYLLRPPGGRLPEATSGLTVREVENAEQLATWERVVVQGYPLPDLQPWAPGVLFTDAVRSSGLRMWLGYAEGEPVAAAASFVAFGLHVLAIGVVLPHARGKGYWRSLLRVRLAAFPGLPSASLFSDMSRPGAQQHGFWPISRFTLWTRERP